MTYARPIPDGDKFESGFVVDQYGRLVVVGPGGEPISGGSGGGGDASADNQLIEIANLEAILIAEQNRYGGGKLAATAQVTASGDTTILTPAVGNKLRIFWVSAINDPDETDSPRIRVGFAGAGDYLYSAYALAHWEVFEGATDQALVVNLDQTGSVAVTVHYQEVT